MAKRRFVKISSVLNQAFYTVETNIGAGETNRRLADVELVQFFLKQFFQDPKHIKETPPTAKGLKRILIDGIVGPQTINAIIFFQKYQFQKIVDGKVSVPKTDLAIEGHQMAIMWRLNLWFARFSPLREDFTNLEKLLVNDNSAPHLLAELVVNDLADSFLK